MRCLALLALGHPLIDSLSHLSMKAARLQGVIRTFSANAKFSNASTAAHLSFMATCIVELFGLDEEAAYSHAFTVRFLSGSHGSTAFSVHVIPGLHRRPSLHGALHANLAIAGTWSCQPAGSESGSAGDAKPHTMPRHNLCLVQTIIISTRKTLANFMQSRRR